MAKLEHLCKNAAEVKKLFKEKYLDRKELLGTKEFPVCDALYIIEKLYRIALYGEKDATYQELEPHFLADERNGKEITGYVPAAEYHSALLSLCKTQEEKDRLIEIMGFTDVPIYGDYVLLSSELKEVFNELWERKDMDYDKSISKLTQARSEFQKEYNVDWWDIGMIEKKKRWEISRCKEPQPETKYSVDRTFVFDKESDIIITDPCYIYKWVGNNHSKWDGNNISSSRRTLYGDWSCSVYECDRDKFPSEDDKPIGSFCADAGLVCVEDIKHNPNKDKIIKWATEHKHCATIINDFVGNIEYQIKTEYYAEKAKWNPSDSLIIRGYGKKDGNDFSFIGCQTGW